ncbi:uncharacterized protein LOC122072047 [Macadamia integrifolia]|uniref:uncharacterized protein LOC122072047 n=1 Tax=Macadamia integrifolia TaxID=60698 RepID=UPI001C4E8658|nr:uncharacterized protein LOC122072047 [Macadamia integrifolia]
MAEEGSEVSVATPSSTPNWWELHAHHHHPLSSWNNNTTPWQPMNPNSNSSCEEDISISPSFTNASNQSGISVDSSRQLVETASSSSEVLMGEPSSDNQLWSEVLLSIGNSGELQNSQDVGDNVLEVLSSKNLSREMFEPAFDYLKKMDNCWELTNSPSLNNLEKQFNGYNGSLLENQRLNYNLSNLSLNNSSMGQYQEPDYPQMKQNFPNSSLNFVAGNNRSSAFLPCYGQDLKVESQQEIESFRASFQGPFNGNGCVGYQMGPKNNSVMRENNKYYYGISNAPLSGTRNLSSFTGSLNKPLVGFQASKACIKPLNSPKSEKQGNDSSSLAKGNGRGTGITNDGKKKRTDDTSDAPFKKPKQESSTTSSAKTQVPKVKLGDKITALQQIVSPFGKTDTASVLWEAIGYIKFLQEQVQLLSDPYMKTNKDPWGSLERKDKGDPKMDLNSRGLCLVPISCTPQVYRENTGSDYWTPTYRGCLYR